MAIQGIFVQSHAGGFIQDRVLAIINFQLEQAGGDVGAIGIGGDNGERQIQLIAVEMIQRPAQVHLQADCQITVCLRHRIQGGHKHHHTTGHGSNAAAIRRHLITERLAQAGEPQIIEQGFLLAGIVVEAGRIGHQII